MLSKLALIANFGPFVIAAAPDLHEAMQGAVVRLKQEADPDLVSQWRDDETSTGAAKAIAYAAAYPNLGPAACFSTVVESFGTEIDRLYRTFDEIAAEYDLAVDGAAFSQKVAKAA